MENADLARMIKNKRPTTFGATPQASAPKPGLVKPKIQPKPEQVSAKAQPAQAETTPDPQAEKAVIAKGISIGLDADGKFVMEFVGNAPNYLELIALFDYTNAKKTEIVEQLTGTGSHATKSYLAQLTKNVNSLAQGLGSIVSEVTKLNQKVETLHQALTVEPADLDE
jgi:hypothetical protein